MTNCESVGAVQLAAHLKACTESREELLAALKAIVDDAVPLSGDDAGCDSVGADLIVAGKLAIRNAEASRV